MKPKLDLCSQRRLFCFFGTFSVLHPTESGLGREEPTSTLPSTLTKSSLVLQLCPESMLLLGSSRGRGEETQETTAEARVPSAG